MADDGLRACECACVRRKRESAMAVRTCFGLIGASHKMPSPPNELRHSSLLAGGRACAQ
ncbi:MAG: hypothetical protein E7K46_08045 [Corynebacterium sp.]|nr:hypothetical protein [Corynebacterium sp.]